MELTRDLIKHYAEVKVHTVMTMHPADVVNIMHELAKQLLSEMNKPKVTETVKTRYDWSKAPKEAKSAVMTPHGFGGWCTCPNPRPNGNVWLCSTINGFIEMDDSAILDHSGKWKDSLEIRPEETGNSYFPKSPAREIAEKYSCDTETCHPMINGRRAVDVIESAINEYKEMEK